MNRKALVGLAIVGVWWLRHGEREPLEQAPMGLQAAVLGDGFAALVGPRDVHDGWRVLDLDRDGAVRRQRALRQTGDVRLVGARSGAAIGWLDGAKLKLGVLDADGAPGDVSTWGKKVVRVCDGAASNEYRFAIGWLESDDRVWFVHGPLAQLADVPTATIATDAGVAPGDAGATAGLWCGIASAERNVVLVWGGNGRFWMNFCGPKACAQDLVPLPMDRGDALLGYGCLQDRCLFATRDKRGATKLLRVTAKGRSIVRELADATGDTGFSIVGAGGRAFAISYVAKDGRATIRRLSADAAPTDVWHFDDADAAPTLAWAADKLLVVYAVGGSERHYTLELPR